MKKIKLSGREAGVLRAIDFNLGTSGAEMLERTQMDPDDLVEIVNSLMELGFIETQPPSKCIDPKTLKETMIEVNPAFVHELREALIRR